MAITVANEPDPRLLAGAAFNIGRSQAYLRERDYSDKQNQEAYRRYVEEWNRQKQLEDERQQQEQEQYNRAQTERQYGTGLEQQQYNRQFAERGYQTGQEQQGFERQLQTSQDERQWQQLEYNREYNQDRTANWKQKTRLLNQQKIQEMARKFNAEVQYTPQQTQDMEQAQNEIAIIQSRDDITPEQKQSTIDQLQERYDGIEENYQLVPKQQDLQSQMQGELVPTPKGYMGRKPDGTWYSIDLADKTDKTEDKELKAALTEAESDLLELDSTQTDVPVDKFGIPKNTGQPAPVFDKDKWIINRAREILLRKQAVKESLGSQGQGFGGSDQGGAAPTDQSGIATEDQGAAQNEQVRQAKLQASQALDQALAGDDPAQLEAALQMYGQAMGGP